MSALEAHRLPPEAAVGGVTMERTFHGLEVRLHSTGFGRFFSAAFLGVWLTFWAVGECVVVYILARGAWSLLTGEAPGPTHDPLAIAPALGMGAFLVLWLAFWTLGGMLALGEFARLLWSDDRLCITSAGLAVTRRAGFRQKQIFLPRETLRRIYRVERGNLLQAETLTESVELTRLGPPGAHDAIVAALRAELKLAVPERLPPLLPAGWQELPAPEGGILLVKDLAIRRTQARIAWLLALPFGAGAIVLVDAAVRDASLIALALVVVAVAGALTWGAVWLSFGRTEWRLENGRVLQQRRFRSRVQPRFEAEAVRLAESRDSDGDPWYAVELCSAGDSAAAPRTSRRTRRTLVSRLHDATEPRRLAEWISAKTGLPLHDAIPTPAANAAEAEALLQTLRSTGRFGHWAARLIARAARNREPK